MSDAPKISHFYYGLKGTFWAVLDNGTTVQLSKEDFSSMEWMEGADPSRPVDVKFSNRAEMEQDGWYVFAKKDRHVLTVYFNKGNWWTSIFDDDREPFFRSLDEAVKVHEKHFRRIDEQIAAGVV